MPVRVSTGIALGARAASRAEWLDVAANSASAKHEPETTTVNADFMPGVSSGVGPANGHSIVSGEPRIGKRIGEIRPRVHMAPALFWPTLDWLLERVF